MIIKNEPILNLLEFLALMSFLIIEDISNYNIEGNFLLKNGISVGEIFKNGDKIYYKPIQPVKYIDISFVIKGD